MTSKTITELQSKGLAMLTHCIFEGKTLRSLATWCKEIFNTSISFGRDIACVWQKGFDQKMQQVWYPLAKPEQVFRAMFECIARMIAS